MIYKGDIHLLQKASHKSVYKAGFTQVIQTRQVWVSIQNRSPRKQKQTHPTKPSQHSEELLSAKCCHKASIRDQAAIQHCNKKWIWHFPDYLPFYWIPHSSEWWLQIPGDNLAYSAFKTGILMAPIRDRHLSSDIVVFILAFCLFCGNCVCTQAWDINRWQSVLSEASPRHLNHPLCRAAWDKFIRNICTGLQQRKWCIFCRLGWENKPDQMMELFSLQEETIPSFMFTSSVFSATWVYCEPSAFAWTWMCGWSDWKTQLHLTSFYFYIFCHLIS